jgi:transcriptional regulator with PAS, ATPase and Fis domain
MPNIYDMQYDKKAAENRSLFLNGKLVLLKEIRLEIQNSWLHCKKAGLNPAHPRLDTFNSLKAAEKPIASFLRRTILSKESQSLYELLKIYSGALFYTHPDSSIVFSQRGNQQLLEYLNSVGLGIGSCLSEENIGTTALALSPGEYHDSWVIGKEHYLDLFTPFTTYAYYGDYYFGGLKINTFIILPKEQFSYLFIHYMRQYNKNCAGIVSSYRSSLEFQLKEVLFRQYEQNQEQGIMLLDSFGKILNTNQRFTQWFQINPEDIKERDCAEIFPELKRVLTSLKTGEVIHLEEVLMENLPVNIQYMHIDVKPVFGEQNIVGLIITFSDKKRIRQGVNKLFNQAYYTFDNILGKSNVIQEVKEKAINAAHGRSPVIITGESGTGKEVFAQAIHNASAVRNGPFVAVNCASISPELIASELFGYVGGSFTGSRKGGSMGKFEYAQNGTIFLDEIGELSMSAQSMLLRVLEERKITRIGSNTEIPINVRLVTATNRDLKKMIKEKAFRADLFYRIYVINLQLPALTDRITDIPILVNSFIDYYNSFLNKKVKNIDNIALSYLLNHRWPGNLRELRNVIECGMNNASGEVLKVDDLPCLSDYLLEDETAVNEQTINSEKEIIQKEKQQLFSLIVECNGNKSKISKKMGISRSTLYKKIKEYNLLIEN